MISWCMVPVLTLAFLTHLSIPVPLGKRTPPQPKEENTFTQLGETIASTLNVTNCWICGGPQELESWPWVPIPLEPAWILSNQSEVRNGSEFWTSSEKHRWHLAELVKGQYCLNQSGGGESVGESDCVWTYSSTEKKQVNCTPYQNWWNDTHIRCHNGNWMGCNVTGTRSFCATKMLTGNSAVGCSQLTGAQSALPAWCLKYNETGVNSNSTHVIWEWHNSTWSGHFPSFWSPWNRSSDPLIKTCVENASLGLWECWFLEEQLGGPLGGGPFGDWEGIYYPVAINSTEPFTINWTVISRNARPALRGHYWICGLTAYTHLPANWSGSCYIGIIRPKFFFLPGQEGSHLGIDLYDDLRDDGGREKRSPDTSLTSTGDANRWGDNWPPERIIRTYGPATWAQDGSWGYRTPIYMLNRLIRLQAVLEIITNQTARALGLLAEQATQTREAVLQHRLVLDYLLAAEGGVCGKLNLSNCCLKIDDNGRVVMEIAQEIRKLAHVPVQTWKTPFGTSCMSWLGGAWWRQILWFLLLAISGIILLPICLPCMMQLITRIVQSSIQKMLQVSGSGEVKIMIMRAQGWIPLNTMDPSDSDEHPPEEMIEEVYQQWCEETSGRIKERGIVRDGTQ
ncbi:uncharacterized protein LOC119946042 [Tachyglossus aculeatus]|uniref:uncharacterized protein LOC119946042 n=1 Tax=Tachyglossus aculeatus TaxID=9261 RepID=UPI0018F545FD|nr:uncharacterized protein LOC119946042 [Tachyglossus aculeatus]XP_038623339.1 uncharacterized protein LOC119946042 [Tachyglossus aculeatus]XP_038623340.1 uncharacterized protein LOC119946042 [Tachyglossus aculeatus]